MTARNLVAEAEPEVVTRSIAMVAEVTQEVITPRIAMAAEAALGPITPRITMVREAYLGLCGQRAAYPKEAKELSRAEVITIEVQSTVQRNVIMKDLGIISTKLA